MGISTEQWRARIGTYNGGKGRRVCEAHQSSFSHHAVFWTTGEIMSTVPLTVQADVAFVSLWMVLDLCVISRWWKKIESSHPTKLNRGSSYHWSKDIRTTVSITVCVSLVTAAAVLLHCLTLLLIMAGDVELNPGPGMDTVLTVDNLLTVFEKLLEARTKWFDIGLNLELKNETLKSIEVENRADPQKCLRLMLTHRLQAGPPLTWRELCECLRSPIVHRNDVAEKIRVWIESQSQDTSEQAGIAGRKRPAQEPVDESALPKNTKLDDFPKMGDLQKERGKSSAGRKRTAPEPLDKSPPPKSLKLDSPKLCLQKETWRRIEAEFGELTSSIKKSFQERNIQPKDLVVECLAGCFHLTKTLKEDGDTMFMQVRKQCEESKSFTDFWSIILDYFTFYSYVILKALVDSKYATKTDKKIFEKYNEKFLRYSKEIVEKCDFGQPINDDDGVTEITVKIGTKFKQINDEHLGEFKEKLAVALKVLSEHLHLIDLRPGCTVLTYHAPLIVEVAAFPLSPEQEDALTHLGVIWLRCGNYKFPSEIPEHPPSDSDPDSDNEHSQERSPNSNARGNSSLTQTNGAHKGNAGSIVVSETFHTGSVDEDSSSTYQTEAASSITELAASERRQHQRKHPDSHSDSGLGTSLPATRSTRSKSSKKQSSSMYHPDAISIPSRTNNATAHLLKTANDLHYLFEMSMPLKKLDQLPRVNLVERLLESKSSLLKSPSDIKNVKDVIDNFLPHFNLVNRMLESMPSNPSWLRSIAGVMKAVTCKLKNNTTVKVHNTVLHTAASGGNVLKVKACLELQHCDPLDINRQGNTALHVAAQAGHLDVVRYLVENAQSYRSSIPFYLEVNNEHETPLHLACLSGEVRTVEYLITEALKSQPLDAFIYATSTDGKNILHFAVLSQNLWLVKFIMTLRSSYRLLRSANIEYGGLPIHTACQEGSIDILRYLLHLYPNGIDCKDFNGWSLLHYAALSNSSDILKYLITEKKTDPIQCLDVFRSTPLHFAAAKGCLESAQFLIEHCGCDPNACNIEEASPLFFACGGGCVSTTKYLIEECNCDSMKEAFNGQTILHTATQNGQYETLEYLIKKGLDPNVYCTSAKALLCCLIIFGNTKVSREGVAQFMKILHEESEIVNVFSEDSPLLAACIADNVQVVKYFVENSNDYSILKASDGKGQTLIHYAAAAGAFNIVQYFVSTDQLDRMSLDNERNTPMHLAAFNAERGFDKYRDSLNKSYCNSLHQTNSVLSLSNDEKLALEKCLNFSRDLSSKSKTNLPIIHYLCSKCDVNCISNSRHTPLHLACASGHLDIVRALIEEMQCDKSLRDEDGINILGYAILLGHLEIIKYLITEQNTDPNFAGTGEVTLPSMLFMPDATRVAVLELLFDELKCDLDVNSNSHGRTWLHIACTAGELECVQYLLGKGYYDVNCRDKEGCTPFHWAVYCGHLDIVKCLSSLSECDMKCADSFGQTPAHMAALKGHLAVLKHICDSNTIIDSLNDQGQTPLHLACGNGHLDVAKFLVEEMKCNKLLRDNRGINALGYTIQFGHLELIKYFIIEQKPDPNIATTGDNIELPYLLFNSKKVAVFKLLFDELQCDLSANLNQYDKNLLHFACIAGALECVQYFVEKKDYDVNCKDKVGFSPLHLAALHGHLDIVKYLSSISQCNHERANVGGGITPVHVAALSGQLAILKYLNDHVHETTNRKETCLHLVCQKGQIDAVRYLTEECGMDVNAQTVDGDTPLHYAAYHGRIDIAEYLMCRQECILMPSNYLGSTPIHTAAFHGKLEIIKWFKRKLSCNLNQLTDGFGHMLIHLSVQHIDILKYLVEDCGVDVDTENEDNERSPLHYAATNGQLKAVEYLVKKGCKTLVKDIQGFTPPHLAIENGQLEIVKYFVKNLDYNVTCDTNFSGRDPIHSACMTGSIDVVKFLVDTCKCNIEMKEEQGLTPLFYAVTQGNWDVVAYLTGSGSFMSMNDKIRVLEKVLLEAGELTPLNALCRFGQEEMVKRLVEEYPSLIHKADEHGLTPLHCATNGGHLSIVKFLINEKHCDPMCKDSDGWIPLHGAALYGNVDVLMYLIIEAKCDANYVSDEGMMPIHYSCVRPYEETMLDEYNKLEIITFLTERSDAIILRTTTGDTPLHLAAANGYLQLVKRLIENLNQNSNSTNKYGCTPLDIATVYHNHEVVEFLQQHTTSSHSPPSVIHLSALLGHISSVQHYITDLQYDPNLQDSIGRTPLHYAAMGGHLDIAEYLISFNADPFSEDVFHNLPLHYAAALGHLEVVQFLSFSDVLHTLTARGVWYKTALEMAMYSMQDMKRLFPHGSSNNFCFK